jgi:DNA mismatch repair protein MutS2
LQKIKFELPEIVKAKPIVSSGPTPIQSAEEFGQKFPAGSKVYVTSLNQDGVIQSQPNAKGEVLILSQSIRLQLHWTELKPAQKAQNPTSQLARRSGQVQVTVLDSDRTIDLRGKTSVEALEELEITLDRATEQNEDRLKIIHGHGTETLKKSIRTYLSRSIYVKKWKAGTPETGGDGVTWVELGNSN